MSKYKVGDKFVIEIKARQYIPFEGAKYYINGFNTLVFDDNGLDRLERYDADAKTKQDEIKVGDELQNKIGERFVVIGLNDDGESVQVLSCNGKLYLRVYKMYVTKTGRHFPIEDILEQLKGADDETD